VIPCFNESQVLKFSVPEIAKELIALREPFQLILVDDGSTDETWSEILKLQEEYKQIIPIKLRRNSGHMMALLAGISVATGEWCVTMDCDLQDPPQLIKMMLEVAEVENSCLVLSQRVSRKYDSFYKRQTAKIFYKLVNFTSPVPVLPNSADFRLMHSCVLNEIRNSTEQTFVFRLMLPFFGFKSSVVKFERPNRISGKTKYNYSAMKRLAFDGLLTFGIRPLRLLTKLGIVTSFFTLIAGLIEAVIWILGKSVHGFPTVILPMLFIDAILLLGIGILGEYVGLTLNEQRGRSRFSIENCSRQLKLHPFPK